LNLSINTSANSSTARTNALLIIAIVCSLALHAAIALFVPSFKFETKKPEAKILEVELVKPKPPEPKPEVVPEQPKPEPPKPEPIKPIEPIKKETPKPLPKKELAPVTPPKQESEPVDLTPPKITPSTIVVEAKPESKPVFVAPEPPPPPPVEPVKPKGPSQDDINAAKAAYRNQIQNELKRHQRYPRIAQERGLQGKVGLLISLDSEGNKTNVTVAESSGNDSLDNAAVDAVNRANIRQFMPDILKGHIEQITVTLNFKLAD
jgi:periplasmic protein TonB